MRSLNIRTRQSSRISTPISSNIISQFMPVTSSKSSRLRLLLLSHFSISITSASSELAKYDVQKLALTLKLDVNNEEVLLQYSLVNQESRLTSWTLLSR